MNDSPVTVEHDGIVITLDERNNLWTFELRGRERKFPSLREARECIDKPEPKKKSEFKRIPCWRDDYLGPPVRVEVTSFAGATGFRGEQEAWIVENGTRNKRGVQYLHPVGPVNDPIVAAIETKLSEIKAINAEIEGLRKTLTPLEVPKDV